MTEEPHIDRVEHLSDDHDREEEELVRWETVPF